TERDGQDQGSCRLRVQFFRRHGVERDSGEVVSPHQAALRASGHPGLPTHDGPAPRIAQRVRVRAHAPFVQGLRMYVLTTTHTGTITRTDVHGPVVSTGPGLQRERGEAVSVESEFMIELDEPI